MTPTPPLALPALPEPHRAASTIKCLACGAPYEPARALAPQAAQAFYPGRMSSSVCKCGSNAFQGTVGYDSPSPAQFTADHMRDYATTAILSDRAGRGDAAGWQPMKSAPKDGTHILAMLPDSDTCHVICWVDSAKGIRVGCGVYGWHVAWDGHPCAGYETPTHWQPLPTPPAAPTGEAS